MGKRKAPADPAAKRQEKPVPERRKFSRLEVPAAAFALDILGNNLGRVVDTSGGGLLLEPASPWARVALVKGQQLTVTVVEPASANRTDLKVEVRYIKAQSIGLRFL